MVHTQPIQNITIVGTGTMGRGIGQEFARAGFPVHLHDQSEDALRQATEKIESGLRQHAAWGLIAAGDVTAAMDRIRISTSLEEACCRADLVIEAVFEDLDLKRRVFGQLDKVCPEHTILGSNTSSYMPSMLAPATRRPDRVLVIHFFYPPPLMPLVEVVRSRWTSDETASAVHALVLAAGKTPIITKKEAMGFVANRLQMALLREAYHIVEDGIATAQDVDVAVKEGFGRRLAVAGPLEMAEVQDGWLVQREINRQIFPDLDNSTGPAPIIEEKVARGEIGAMTGKGFYTWTPESLDSWYRRLTTTLAGMLRSE